MSLVDIDKGNALKATKEITIIGMSDDGCVSLTSKAIHAVEQAQVLVGGERLLEFFPQFDGLKIPIKGKITDVIQRVDDLSQENNVVILASGDPLFYGIGGLLVKKLGVDRLDIISHPSSIQLAFSSIPMSWQDADVFSLHGRSRKGFINKLQHTHKVAVLTDKDNSPSAIAQYMHQYHETKWVAWVCENLGSVDQRVRRFAIDELMNIEDIGDLNVLILIRDDAHWQMGSHVAFIDDDDFDKRMPKKGLITKREVRLLSLGFMKLRKDSVVWDIGTASGSVAIESAKMCYEGEVHAIEVEEESVKIARENCIHHKVDNVEVIEGKAPDALQSLPRPNAIFVGGTKGSMRDILDLCLDQLQENGALVVNAITMENIQEAYQYFKDKNLKPKITMVGISRGVPLARYHRYEALNPVHIFAVTKNGK